MMKRVFVLLLVFSVLLTGNAVYAESTTDPQPTYSTEPQLPESIQRQQDYENEFNNTQIEAWEIDKTGKRKKVAPQLFNNNAKVKSGEMSTDSYTSGGYYYEWSRYIPNITKADPYKFLVQTASLRNETLGDLPLKYTQTNTISKSWIITGKVEAEASFKAAIFSEISVKLGVEVTNNRTATSSTTIEFGPFTVHKGYTGYIEKYFAGAYSGGAGEWNKYQVIAGSSYMPFVSTYQETGSAWAINKSATNYIAREVKNS